MVPLIRRVYDRAYWWMAKRVSPRRKINGIDLVHVTRHDAQATEKIESMLAAAMDEVAAARGGFGELVGSHIRIIGVLDTPSAFASPSARAYVSAFQGQEATSVRYLACKLVWAATFIRLSRDAWAHGKRVEAAAIRQAAFEAQLRFVRQFADSEQWVAYLESNRSQRM